MKIVPCLERKYLVSNPHISFLLVSSYLLVMVDSRKVLTICRIIFRLSILGPSANASSTQLYEICLLMYIALNFRNVRPFSTSLYSPIFLFSFPALAGFSASCSPPPPSNKNNNNNKAPVAFWPHSAHNSKGHNFKQSPLCKCPFDVFSKFCECCRISHFRPL